ncbi:hypothetical protein TNCV_2602731 [Trichonephila clavipes]|nr:hypothetical protein TNCV_2602731 [Trichonephila clavipes]
MQTELTKDLRILPSVQVTDSNQNGEVVEFGANPFFFFVFFEVGGKSEGYKCFFRRGKSLLDDASKGTANLPLERKSQQVGSVITGSFKGWRGLDAIVFNDKLHCVEYVKRKLSSVSLVK